jgi:hypothetical protein
VGGCRVSANEYSCVHGAQINYGDLSPYLTFVLMALVQRRVHPGSLIRIEPGTFLVGGRLAYHQLRHAHPSFSYATPLQDTDQ